MLEKPWSRLSPHRARLALLRKGYVIAPAPIIERAKKVHDFLTVGAVPGSSFFREPVNHLIRFHFAKKDETLNDALNRLEALRSKIPARAAR